MRLLEFTPTLALRRGAVTRFCPDRTLPIDRYARPIRRGLCRRRFCGGLGGHFADGIAVCHTSPEEATVEVLREIAYEPNATETFSKGQIMASKAETNESASKSEAAAKSATKAEKLEARAHRKEARAQKSAESGKERAAKLCMFTHVDVKKSDAGFQFSVRGAERRFKFVRDAMIRL